MPGFTLFTRKCFGRSIPLPPFRLHPAMSAVREEAIKMASEAVELDRQKRYQEALNLYMSAIERFLHVIKCECAGDGERSWKAAGKGAAPARTPLRAAAQGLAQCVCTGNVCGARVCVAVEKVPTVRAAIERNVLQYVNRAEELKAELHKPVAAAYPLLTPLRCPLRAPSPA